MQKSTKKRNIELLKALNNEQEASLSALKEIQQAETPKRKGRDTVSTENPTQEEKTQSSFSEEKKNIHTRRRCFGGIFIFGYPRRIGT